MENQPMTAADLAALEALIGKSDALPWEVQNDGWTIRVEQQDAEKDRKWRVAMTHNSGPNRVEREVANAELIVAAVNALPGLIARVRELERTQRRDPPDGSTHWDIAEVGAVCHDACAVEQIKAAALAMRERCAQACDAKARQYDRFAMPGDAAVADECAAAVRALEP